MRSPPIATLFTRLPFRSSGMLTCPSHSSSSRFTPSCSSPVSGWDRLRSLPLLAHGPRPRYTHAHKSNCDMLRGSGFSLGYFKRPGRKSLDEVCKQSLFEMATPQQVATIWNNHHQQFVQYWGRAISAEAYYALEPRLKASPYFVIPIFRDKGLFNVVTNFKDDLVGVAPLGEWQKKQDNAEIHMTVQFFTELARSKQLVLVRCEIKDEVFKRLDCIFLTQMLLKHYTFPRLYETWVETFNKRPGQFDYHAFLRAMKDEAGKDNIEIKDRKNEMRHDAFGPVIDTPPDSIARQIMGTLNTVAPTPS